MIIEETFNIAAPCEQVWQFMTDPEQIGRCIPGCQSIEVTGPRTYSAIVQVAVGPIKVAFNLQVEVTEEVYLDRIVSKIRGEEGSRSSTLTSDNFLRLKPLDGGGTNVVYGADVSISGRLGKYGQGAMKQIARRQGNKFAEAICKAIEMGEEQGS